VDIHDIDVCNTEPRPAVVERAEKPFSGVIVALHVRRGIDVAVLIARSIRLRVEDAADLGRQQITRAWHLSQACAQALLRSPVAIVGSCVEVASSLRVGVTYKRYGDFIRHRTEQIAERCTAESERCFCKATQRVEGRRHRSNSETQLIDAILLRFAKLIMITTNGEHLG
jgi:hypothetical protein